MKNIETFKQRLIAKGVYKNAIRSNDWVMCGYGYWVITIPYGSNKNGGLSRRYKRFSDTDVKNAVKFWFDNVDRNAVFAY